MRDIHAIEMTIENYHKALVMHSLSVQEVVAYYLNRIESYDQKGPKINAIIRLNPNALEEAKVLDLSLMERGICGPLFGVPVLLKDNIETGGLETTAGSRSMSGYIPDEDAFIVKKLREAGAIILAKANLHEFAIWGESISSILGQTLNPYDLTRTPGGSSGGTGAGLAANFALVGIGTDTINSVRSPSSANAIVGIRPTRGLISGSGIVPYSWTQDTAGPMARTVADAVRLLDVIKGYDEGDPCTVNALDKFSNPLTQSLLLDGLRGKRIGVLNSFFGNGPMHQAVNRAMTMATQLMQSHGAELIPVEEPFDSDELVSEVSVHLFDLKDHLNRYLSQINSTSPIHSFKEILDSGQYHPGIYDNLIKASKLSTDSDVYKERLVKSEEVRGQFLMMMARYELDAIIYPHQKQLVCPVGSAQSERNGALASVTGFPAICVPVGFSDSTPNAPIGVPIGMEIMGRPFSEPTLIEIAYGFEQASHIRRSPKSVSVNSDPQ